MAAANDEATIIQSNIFHPEHPLQRYHYDGTTSYSCAACEHIIVAGGIGYSCDDCNFNIHEACLKLPKFISLDKHSHHKLTLTRLGATRWCAMCKETSHAPAGIYMYRCVACDYDVHPRCTSVVDAPAQLPRQQQAGPSLVDDAPAQPPRQQQAGRTGRRRRAIKTGARIVVTTLKVADLLTGGFMSPVLDVIGAAVDA